MRRPRVWAAVVAVGLAACGSTAGVTRIAEPVKTVAVSDIRPDVVIVRGRENLAYVAETGELWRIEGAKATAAAHLHSFGTPSGAPFGGALSGGAVLVGGVRCADAACDTTAYEAAIVHGDRTVE